MKMTHPSFPGLNPSLSLHPSFGCINYIPRDYVQKTHPNPTNLSLEISTSHYAKQVALITT